MTLYLDTSAIVKLYLSEEGSHLIRRLAVPGVARATTLVTYVEARSAFSRKFRLKELSEQAFLRHKREFENDWENITKVVPDRRIIMRAASLLELFSLKAYDAIHLASAELVEQGWRSRVTFASFDRALNAAAARLDFAVLGPI